MIVKMTILRLLGSSDDKEKIGVARPEGPPLWGFRYPVSGRGSRGSRPSRVSGQRPESSSIQEHRKNRHQGIGASGGSRKNRCHDTLVQKGIEAKLAYRHRLNRRSKKGIGAMAVLCTRGDVKCPEEVSSAPVQPTVHRCIPPV